MFQFPQQVSAAAKSQLEAQLNAINKLTGKALASAEQLITLHLDLGRGALDQTAATAKDMLSARDARELMAIGANHAGPTVEQLFAYGRQLFSIAAGTPAALANTVTPELPVLKLALAPPPAAAPAPVVEAPVEPVVEAVAVAEPVTAKAAPEPAPTPLETEITSAPVTRAVAKAAKPAAAKPAGLAASSEPKQRDSASVKAQAAPKTKK